MSNLNKNNKEERFLNYIAYQVNKTISTFQKNYSEFKISFPNSIEWFMKKSKLLIKENYFYEFGCNYYIKKKENKMLIINKYNNFYVLIIFEHIHKNLYQVYLYLKAK